MSTYPVKWLSSDMQGAPNLGDTADGALTALLKAALVTGFGSLVANAISFDEESGCAVATFNNGHKFLTDSIVMVEGVSPASYNGEHRVKKASSNQVWFEIDGGNPGSPGSGAFMSMKVAPLGWVITHESSDGKKIIIRPSDDYGNVSLMVDNTSFSGWSATVNTATHYLAKVALVEDVIDINTYTLIYEHRWMATQRYSLTKEWDLIGDSGLFYWLPAMGNTSFQTFYCFGYIRSVRPNDRYHAIIINYYTTNAADGNSNWANMDWSTTNRWGTPLSTFDNTEQRMIARGHTQMGGAISWWIKGLFGRIGGGVVLPNTADNAFYASADPIVLMEAGNVVRGFLPGIVVPFSDAPAWNRKNFSMLPAIPNKIVRFIRPLYQTLAGKGDFRSMVGFDLSGPWR